MGLIHEETKHESLGAEFMVDERTKGECREPWRFVSLRVDTFEKLTPKEMRELGRWLQKEGRRLGRDYTSKGAPKQAPNVPRNRQAPDANAAGDCPC